MRTSNIIDNLCNGRNRRPADREMPSQSGRRLRNQHVNITPVIRITNWKKSVYTITGCLLAVLAAVSCAKDDDTVTLHALMADMPGGGQKVYIDDHYACWEDGDPVAINGTNYAVAVTDGSNRAATMQVSYSESGYTGAYPADYVTTCTGGNIVLTMPSTQTVVMENGHQQIVAPMVGHTANAEPTAEDPLMFHNVAGVLKINVKNSLSQDLNIYALEIESSNAYIAGTGTVDGVDTPTPSLTISSDKTKNVMLMCNNVALASKGSADFYLVVAPFTDPTKFTVHVLATGDTNNLKYTFHRESKSGITIARNQIGSISVDVDSTHTYPHIGDEGNYFWGQGTQKCPFMITCYEDLNTLRHLVNHSGTGYTYNDTKYNTSSVYYRQTADIDMSSITTWGQYSTSSSYSAYNNAPIGYSTDQTYHANYDGMGHYIKLGITELNGTYMLANSVSTTQGPKYGIGVFGVCSGGGSIKNVVTKGNVSYFKSSGKSMSCFGSLVGIISGDFSIDNCQNETSIIYISTGYEACVAGIVGAISINANNTISISNCINNAQISSTAKYGSYDYSRTGVGGICAFVYNITSGASISFESCKNLKAITGNSIYGGGILGAIYSATNTSITFTKCENQGNVSCSTKVGGIVGSCYNTSGTTTTITISGRTQNIGTISGTSSYVGGIVGYSAGNISIDGNTTNNETISGTTSVGGIVGYSARCNITGTTINEGFISGNGGGSGSGTGGIIGTLFSNNSTYFENKITKCWNKARVRNTGSGPCGGIIGRTAQVEVNGCKNTGSLYTTTAADYTAVGGIIGVSNGGPSTIKIYNCAVESDTLQGATTGTSYCGGIFGYARDNIDMKNCYAIIGVASSKTSEAGILGYQAMASATTNAFTNCYAIINCESATNKRPILYKSSSVQDKIFTITYCYCNSNYCSSPSSTVSSVGYPTAYFETTSGHFSTGTSYQNESTLGGTIRRYRENVLPTYTSWTSDAIPKLNLTF